MSTAEDRRWFQAVAEIGVCQLCGAHGVQVAHRNEGKGTGTKTAAHMTAALCPTCHFSIDNGKHMERSERRAMMDLAIVRTHDALIRSGRLRLVP